ncbi:MAG: carboxypeptidase regulatory-like domain-containing protein [Terriglobales bacterium]
MTCKRLWMLAISFVVLFLPGLVFAQNAKVYGTVYDVKGNPYPRVVVELQNPATGVKRAALTDDDGNYAFSEVPPADGYQISATVAGKTIAQQVGLAVRVGDEKLLIPPLQEVATGPGEEAPKAVSAAAAGPSVNTEVTSSIGTVISSAQLDALPVYNRNFLAFGLLNPNAHDVEAGSALAGATFSVAGARPSSNNFLLDGADNVASSSGQAIPFQVNDSVQEFRVISSNANAEFGRNQGGIVNVVTRRAITGIHGKVFGFFGSDKLNSDNPLSIYRNSGFEKAAAYAGSLVPTPVVKSSPSSPLTVSDYNTYVATAQNNGYCTDSISNPTHQAPNTCVANGFGRNTLFNPSAVLAGIDKFKQPFSSQQFGASMGGGLRGDRLFFFGSYEGTRIDNPNPLLERVPSSFDKSVANLCAAGSACATAVAGLPAGQFNLAALGPASQRLARGLLALYPNPNVVAVPGVLEFYRGVAPNYSKIHNLLLRADYKQSQNSDVLIRYAIQSLNQLHDDTLPSSELYPGNGAVRHALNQSAILGFSHRFSPKVSNDARIGMTRFQVIETPQDAGFDPTTLGLPAGPMWTLLLSGLDSRYSGAAPTQGGGAANFGAYTGWQNAFWSTAGATNVMAPTLDGLFPFARLGAPLAAPSGRRDTTVFGTDAFSWTFGRHSLKFGGEYRRLENVSNVGGFSRGLVISGDIGEFVNDSETCLNCDASSNGFVNPSFDYAWRQRASYSGIFTSFAVAGFAQDSWHVNPHLVLNYGVRYEYFSVPTEGNNLIYNFDPAANGLYQQGGSTITDPYGYGCALHFLPSGGGATGNADARTDFIYPVRDSAVYWNCKASSSRGGSILPSQTHNFAPRFGFAYALDKQTHTVIRGGIGLYYDQLPLSLMSQLLFNRPTPMNFANPQAIYGQNFQSTVCNLGQCGLGDGLLSSVNPNLQSFASAAIPFALYSRDYDNAKTPYTRQISGSIQHQINNKLVAEIGYVGTRAYHLPVVYNSGFNNEWFCTTTPGCDTISYSPVFTMTNSGQSSYHSAMVRLRAADWHGLNVNLGYSFSKSLDNGSQGTFPLLLSTLPIQVFGLQAFSLGNPNFLTFGAGRGSTANIPAGGLSVSSPTTNLSDLLTSGLTTTGASQVFVSRYDLPQDPTNFLRNDYGRSDFDSHHRFVMDYTWALPLPKDSKFLSNWQVSGVVILQSGQPFTVFAGPAYGELTQRANVGSLSMTGNPNGYFAGTVTLPGTACLSGGDGSLYVTGSSGLFNGVKADKPCIGTSGRNAFTGPSYITSNMAVQKMFFVSNETKQVVIRVELFNMLNRSNFYNPISAVSLDGSTPNPYFGRVQSAHDPRQVQLALRFNW